MSETSKLKILAVIPSGFCFGLQHITVDFFSNFSPAIESHFLLTKWGDGQLAIDLQKKGIPFSMSWLGMFSRKMDPVNIKMSAHALVKLPKLYLDFLKLIRKFQPDILYFANHHELILLYPALFFTKRKIICHMHDPTPAIPFQKRNFKWYGKKVDHFIAISGNVRERTIALGCAPQKVTTIHNGIRIPSGKRAKRLDDLCDKAGWAKNVFIIGITGQMTATKGHMDLLDAFRLVYSKNNEARLLIGGRPQEPFYSELKERIAELKMNALVHFTGWLPEVSLFFQNIDLFVLASRHEEGYGLVVAEAMAYGLPVVITKSGGAVEIVEEGVNGYVVPKEDIEVMASRIYELSIDRQACKRFGDAGRTRVEKHFNLQTQTEILESFLKEIKQA